MKKTRIAAIAVVISASLALFGWGVVAGAEDVMGIVAAEGSAQVVVSDQPDASGAVIIDKVVAPQDAFVVVHQNDGGMPGERLGYAAVKKGVTRNVRVELDPDVTLTPQLLAAVHADHGKRGEFEFDMENIERSPDRPFFVDGAEVAASFTAAEFGVVVSMDEASISVEEQPLGDTVIVASASAPTNAFVVIHEADADGMPGKRVGFTAIPAGLSENVEVDVTGKLEGTTALIAAVHADRAVQGKLEFDMDDPVASPDQPFFAEGMEVAKQFMVGPFGVKASGASIEATDQIGVEKALVIDRVDAPDDAWVVVHKEVGGRPGERVGFVRVSAGVSTDVEVPLSDGVLPERLIVALHADKGQLEKFEFDMGDKLGSPDQPYFVDGDEVAAVLAVRAFGYETPMGTAGIDARPQKVAGARLFVTRASSPEDAWVVVHLDAGGMPGARVGLLHIPAGTTRNAYVQLDASKQLTDTLFVAVHADRGEPGVFEFDMMDRVNSADQPYFVDGMEVATGVTIR